MNNQHYHSPLEGRYSSPEMQGIWSDRRKFTTWRRLWLALAESQQELGLPITDTQIAELRAHLDDIDYDAAARYERELRHDVMAHVHALGDVAPAARPIIHLGATSQDINCNTELLQLRDALSLIAIKLARVIDSMGHFASRHRALPTLGFTHYQPAQPVTVGKRATLWAQDFALTLTEVERQRDSLRLRGVKGATGTQASFLELLGGDEDKVERLDQLFCQRVRAFAQWEDASGWDDAPRRPSAPCYAVTGQTYPRVVDAFVVNVLAAGGAVVHKTCNDIRLLANRKEIEEPFEKSQIGSSAMPYKRNPMRCERAASLARFVMSLAQNPLNTAAAQWFERTLDDSANRRLTLPEAFLALDGALDIMHNVCAGLVVYEATIRANLMAELPFMASENLLMSAVKAGADRQQAHEVIRAHAQAAAERVKRDGASNDLLARLKRDPLFAQVNMDAVMDPSAYVGRATSQTDAFIRDVVEPIRARYGTQLAVATKLRV